MVPKLVSIWSVLALAHNVYSLTVNAPKVTATPVVDDKAISPVTTEGPSAKQVELRKRATAYDWECGFYAGTSEATCLGTCGFLMGAGTSIQGCCLLGTSYCTFATTCYDYATVSQKCDSTCQLYNNGVLPCTDSFAPYCYSLSYGNGAKGYMCGSNSLSTSTWIAVTSTALFFSTTTTASPTTYSAAQFVFSTGPSLYSYSTRTYSSYSYPYSTYTARSGGGSSSYYTSDTALAAAALVPLIVVLVIYGLYYVCAIALLIYMCRRSKRLVAAWYQPGGALNRSGLGAGAPGVMAASNVMAPGAVAGAPPPVYYMQQPGGAVPPYVSPQATGTTGYFPVSENGSTARGVSPPTTNTGISPIGSSPGSMPAQPIQGVAAPGTPGPQEPRSGAHEMQ